MDQQEKHNKLFLWDFIAFVVVIAICALFFVIRDPSTGKTAKISVAGKTTQTVELSKDQEITAGNVKLKIKNGTIEAVSSTCKDKLCIEQGAISKVGESIICAPNRVIVEIVGEDQEEVDQLAY